MKRTILCLCLLVMSIYSWAQGHENTTDHASLGVVELTPGGDTKMVSVSVENISRYAAFGLDLYLPAGYSFVLHENDDEEMVYIDKGTALKSSHTIDSNIQDDGALRVTAISIPPSTFKTSSNEIFKFSIKASPYAKPGYADIQIKNCFFTDADGIQYDAKDITINDKVSASTSSSLPFSVSSSAHWSTCILPFATEVPTGVVAYTCSKKSEDNLLLTESKALEAYTPYILYSENGYSGTLSGTVNPAAYPTEGFVKSGYLCGAIVPQVVNDGYVLQNLSDGVKFYSCNGEDFSIPAGKCWVEIDEVSAKNGFGFIVDDQQTPVRDIIDDTNDNTCYTLSGLRINAPIVPGIYIINNKKVIVNK